MLDAETITLTEAQERIQAWRSNQTAIQAAVSSSPLADTPPLKIHAFTFHLREMMELCIRMYNYDNPETPINIDPETIPDNPLNAIRFYVGKKSPQGTDPYACLIAVAVKGFDGAKDDGGEDVIDLPLAGVPVANAIYDFSFPCPMTCAQPGHSIMDINAPNQQAK